jgi:hypothetical protein
MSEMKQQLALQQPVHQQQQQRQQELEWQQKEQDTRSAKNRTRLQHGGDEPENEGEHTGEKEESAEELEAMSSPPCNRFLLKGQPDFETPKRIYAVLDQAEISENGEHLFMFGGLNADFFDERRADIEAQAAAGDFDSIFADLPLFLLEIKLSLRALSRLYVGGAIELKEDDQIPAEPFTGFELQLVIEELEGRWIEFTLEDTGGSALGVLYRNLFGEPQPTAVSTASPPIGLALQALAQIDPLAGINSTDADIKKALAPAGGTLEEIVIYDVGQGGACGLLSSGRVAAYFDFGGGVAGHTRTFPGALTHFCFCNTSKPPIILSHWDHDHWSSEGRDSRSHSTTWIAPRQPAGGGTRAPHHSALASSIRKHGTLLIWPASLPSLAVGQIRIRKCTGASRNASGLAVEVDPPKGYTGAPVLLPGDAGYDDIPGASSATFEGIACPHHGGASNSPVIPAKPAPFYSRLAYSYGSPNTYHHPLYATYTAHDRALWTDPRVPGKSAPGFVRDTKDRTRKGVGHIGFNWGTTTAPSAAPCSGTCQLDVQQY